MKNLVEELLNQEVQKMNKGTMDALKQALDDRLALDLDIDIHVRVIGKVHSLPGHEFV